MCWLWYVNSSQVFAVMETLVRLTSPHLYCFFIHVLMKVLPWGRGMGEMVHVDSISGAHSDTTRGYGTCNRSSGWYMIRHVSCHGLVGHFALTSLHLFQSKHDDLPLGLTCTGVVHDNSIDIILPLCIITLNNQPH